MNSFSLVIEYLTGYAVATDPSTRERAEWPPHPARIFMALAAAHFETDGPPEQKQAEREALEWLAALPSPDISVPNHSAREVCDVYVPVNDQDAGEALLRRSRQPRVFPRVFVGNEPVRFIWNVDPHVYATFVNSLKDLSRHVTRVGHSSSLVWMRIEDRVAAPSATHTPDGLLGNYLLRMAHRGAVAKLERAYNATAIEEFRALDVQRREAKGKAEKQRLQSLIAEQFPRGEPKPQYPTFSIRERYRQIESVIPDAPASLFDPNLIILSEAEDQKQTFGLESTSLATSALRNLIMSKAPQPPPAWVSGHEKSGDKLESSSHISLIPLAFVGGRHADGHLMGTAIVFPRDVPHMERAAVLSSILFNPETNEPEKLTLLMGKAGVWKVMRETSVPHQQTLKGETYTRPSQIWASVTPVVLDRMPKADRANDPMAWREQTAAIIAQSCINIGLPEPSSVRVEKTPFFRGSLRAMPGQGGFPVLKQGRFQVHAMLTFAQDVAGPVIIGAGRFRGYGLCRPWRAEP